MYIYVNINIHNLCSYICFNNPVFVWQPWQRWAQHIVGECVPRACNLQNQRTHSKHAPWQCPTIQEHRFCYKNKRLRLDHMPQANWEYARHSILNIINRWAQARQKERTNIHEQHKALCTLYRRALDTEREKIGNWCSLGVQTRADQARCTTTTWRPQRDIDLRLPQIMISKYVYIYIYIYR